MVIKFDPDFRPKIEGLEEAHADKLADIEAALDDAMATISGVTGSNMDTSLFLLSAAFYVADRERELSRDDVKNKFAESAEDLFAQYWPHST